VPPRPRTEVLHRHGRLCLPAALEAILGGVGGVAEDGVAGEGDARDRAVERGRRSAADGDSAQRRPTSSFFIALILTCPEPPLTGREDGFINFVRGKMFSY
jgi:hypothetical protein